MRLAIPAKGKNSISKIDDRFGRCEYFVIYDSKNDSIDSFENEAKNAAGGAGGKAVRGLSTNKVDAALVPELGPKASEAMAAFGIKAYKIKDCTVVQEAIDKFKNNELELVESATVNEHAGLK